MDEITESIRHYILTTALVGESPDNLKNNLPLITGGLLDSLGALGLVSFLEKKYGIELDVDDTSVERFDSISDIATTVGRKVGVATGSK